MTDLNALLEKAPQNLNIYNSLIKARAVLERHMKIAVSVSGGADSNIVLDLLELVKPDNCDLKYVFFETGLEYLANKRHLDYLEQKYGITIERQKPRKPLPLACKEHGIPFISKDVSSNINRLQKHNFDWNDLPENATEEKYGRCKSALDWYFNRRAPSKSGKDKFQISRHKLLREFIMANIPDYSISDSCCTYVKKQPAADFNKEYKPDLSVNGMRQAEGGRRAGSVKTCFSPSTDKEPDNYRPIWFWADEDKAVYKEWRGLRFSDCYEVYHLKRTGCVGCPCGSKAEQELAMVEPFEPEIVSAARKIFGASYEYRRKYSAFKAENK